MRFVYLTAAVTGGIILIVEILGAKMLSPYFGTSHFVWTAQIAVTLVSLAVGYYLGGTLADRRSRLGTLYYALLGAGIYLCLVTVFLDPVAYFFLRFKLAFGSVLASSFLFFVPLTLLAMTVPFVIRASTRSLEVVGRQVGRLSAVSTAGSVLGTVLIGYVLIPFLPNTVTLALCGAVLFLVVLIYFALWGRKPGALSSGVFGAVLGGLLGLLGLRMDAVRTPALAKELLKVNSNFGLMQVLENKAGNRRYYLNDYLTQNIYDPKAKQSLTVFTYMLHDLARAYRSEIKDLLCIGLGMGIAPEQFAREGVKVDVVEINPKVVEIGERYFDLDPSKLEHIYFSDGRYYLNETRKRYDAVLLDAFLGDSSPSHLMTRESFERIRSRMKPGGVLVINSFGYLEPGKDFFIASLQKTLDAVFASVRVHDGQRGNVFFVASDRDPLTILNPPEFSDVHPSVRSRVRRAYANVVRANPRRGRVLSDNYNPVEYFDAGVREAIRRELAYSMRARR